MNNLKAFASVVGVAIAFAGGAFLFTMAFVQPSMNGIIPLGENGVLLCGEALTINATEDVSDSQMRNLFEQAMTERNTTCKEF